MYNLPWHSKGVNPDEVPEHQYYVDRLCQDVSDVVCRKVDDVIGKAPETSGKTNALLVEIEWHLELCRKR